MATYRMANVWRDPRTGMCYFRRRVPADLRRLLGWEQKISLHTKDPKVARQRYAVVQLEADQHIREARQRLAEERREVDFETLQDAYKDSVTPAWRQWDYALRNNGARGDIALEPADLTDEPPEKWRRPFSSTRLAKLLGITRVDQIEAAERALAGGHAVPEHVQAVTLATIFAAWADERQPPSKTRASWGRAIARLAEFLQHDKAEQVTRKDVIRWKDHLRSQGLSAKTVSDLIGTIKTIYGHALQNELISGINPGAGVKVTRKADPASKRLPYSDEDAVTILKATRGETGARRWVPWLLLWTGARLDEVCQLNKADIKCDPTLVRELGPEAGWFIDIHPGAPGEGRRLKTPGSARRVPLHQQVLDEGFVEWVLARPEGPLFDDLKPDRWGSRGGTASTTIGPWIRSLGITDPRKVLHSARHRFKDVCRNAPGGGIAKDLHDALTGHAAGDVGSTYGRGFSLRSLRLGIDKLPHLDL
jgi:integrase